MFNSAWLNSRYHAELPYLLLSWNVCFIYEPISQNVTVDFKKLASQVIWNSGEMLQEQWFLLPVPLLLTPVHSWTGLQSSFDPCPWKIYDYKLCVWARFQTHTFILHLEWRNTHVIIVGVWAIATVITKEIGGGYKHGEIRVCSTIRWVQNVHNEWMMWYYQQPTADCYKC